MSTDKKRSNPSNETAKKGSRNEKSNPKDKKTKVEIEEKEEKEDQKIEKEFIGPHKGQENKEKKLEFEKLYLERLPNAKMYERSYMHRENVTHICVTSTEFIITGSRDGHIKFWKKISTGIEFVKHYIAHLNAINSISSSVDGLSLATTSDDQTIKIFDVINFGKKKKKEKTVFFFHFKKNF